MKVFVTGATGLVGSAVVQELLKAGYQVLGLARSDESAKSLQEKGVEVLRGDLEDTQSLKKGAERSEGVIHTAFIHDFSRFQQSAATDKIAIETIGSVLKGSDHTFLVTGGLAGVKAAGELVTEEDAAPSHPRASESTAVALADSGVKASVVRLPPSVHGKEDRHGFVPALIKMAKEKGVSAYPNDGSNRWPAVHVLDAAVLYRLAFEKGAGGWRYNVTGDEGVSLKEIAEVIGKNLNLPVVSKSQNELADHFGWMSRFITMDVASSGEKTSAFLGWKPTHIGLVEDMNENYFRDYK